MPQSLLPWRGLGPSLPPANGSINSFFLDRHEPCYQVDANHDDPYLSHVCEKANHRVALFKEPLQYTRCVETARVGEADLSSGCHDCRILLYAGASGLPGKEKEARQAAVFSRVKSHGTTQHGGYILLPRAYYAESLLKRYWRIGRVLTCTQSTVSSASVYISVKRATSLFC